MSLNRVLLSGGLWLLLATQSVLSLAVEQVVVVVLDDSGSMDRPMKETGGKKMDAAKKSLRVVLDQLPAETQFGVLALNSNVNGSHWIVPIGSADPHRWRNSLDRIRAKGGTPLGANLRAAADALLELRSQKPYATYRLLVVTDGEATDAKLLNRIMPDLLSRGISLDVIGVDMNEEHSLARQSHSYRRAGDQASLTEALTEVFAESVDDGGASQGDFEMLAGLSDESAMAIVKGLTSARNDPLGELDGRAIDTSPVGPSSSATPSPAASVRRPSILSGLVGAFCCMGFFIMLTFFLTTIIVRAVKQNTRS